MIIFYLYTSKGFIYSTSQLCKVRSLARNESPQCQSRTFWLIFKKSFLLDTTGNINLLVLREHRELNNMAVYLKVMELWRRVSHKVHASVFLSKLQSEITQSLRAATNLTGDKLIYESFLMWVSTLSTTGPGFIGLTNGDDLQTQMWLPTTTHLAMEWEAPSNTLPWVRVNLNVFSTPCGQQQPSTQA